MDTMLIELTNQKATGILYELEGLNVIKILRGYVEPPKVKLSDKYKGFITREEGQQLNDHNNYELLRIKNIANSKYGNKQGRNLCVAC